MMHELWLTEEPKETNLRDQRINDLQIYMNSNFINKVFNRPPHGAYEKFGNTDLFALNECCLKVAKSKIETLISKKKELNRV